MAFNISIEVYGVEEVIQWANALPSQTQRQAYQVFQRWGKEMVRIGKDVSPKDKIRGIDPRRRSEKDSFAQNWQYDARMEGDGAALDVGNVAEHMGFVIHDTPPRAIPKSVPAQLAKGYPMRFYWPAIGGWFSTWMIHGGVAAHGTKGRPVHEWILKEFNVDSHLSDISGGIS